MRLLRDRSIRVKLSGTLAVTLALILVIGAISLVQLWGINALASKVIDHWLPEMDALGETKLAMEEHRLLALRRFSTTNFRQIAADAAEMQAAEAAVSAGASRLAALAHDRAESEFMPQFREAWAGYLRSLNEVTERLDSGDPDTARVEFDRTTTARFADARSTVDDLLTASRDEGRSAARSVRGVFGLSLGLIIGVLFLSVLTVIGAIRWISSSVSRPILRISDAMRRLTVGDNSVTVTEGVGREDEIGVLAGAVAGYRASLDRVRQLAELSADERQRLDAALTNMSQGLCMFDATGRLVIHNARFAAIYGLRPDRIRPGMTTRELMAISFRDSKVTAFDKEGTLAIQERLLREKSSGALVERLSDGRSIAIAHRPMPDGGFVATFEDITERLSSEERIRHLAHFDALTDLLNRVAFYERVQTALGRLRGSESMAVLSLDLDRFKSVNDTLGHPAGDQLLQTAAERLASCVRGEDIVARLGGDEFALVQVPSGEPQAVTALAARLIEVVGAPYDIEGHQVIIGVSVGIAVAPTDGNNPDTLMKNADLALYRAKADGGGVYRFFELEMDARMQARRVLELDLRKAILNSDFQLCYQPIVDVKSGAITSCEALVRWNHPQRGEIQPLEFIPIAEATGLIVQVGEWVIRRACEDAARWPKPVVVAVNLSPAQFKSRNLVPTIVNALASSGLPPGRLELEITELVLLQENEGAFAILHQLRELGIKIAMDDFGTGYSSLGYLRAFPFDKIKIDQSFIRDLPRKEDSLAIVRAVVGLSSSLGITTIAEGVETVEQLASLTSEGCNEFQGFLFSKPRPAGDIARLLGRETPRVEAVA